MDALDEYGSSDNESAGAPASNAVPAALTSPPGSPSTRNAAQALVQLERGFCCARCCAVLTLELGVQDVGKARFTLSILRHLRQRTRANEGFRPGIVTRPRVEGWDVEASQRPS